MWNQANPDEEVLAMVVRTGELVCSDAKLVVCVVVLVQSNVCSKDLMQ